MSESLESLRALGVSGGALEELTAYTENPYRELSGDGSLEWTEEPQIEAWSDYVAEAQSIGAAATLRRRLVQLAFPIRRGVSQDPAYRASVVRSQPPPATGGVEFVDPSGVTLRLHPSPAGLVPVIEATHREDFVSLVRALVGRSEPIAVPEAMGACLVRGLINQDRVARYRSAWATARGEDGATAWKREMGRLAPRKELYQDRLILLSRGPYSAVPAAEVQSSELDWIERSQAIRLDHECLHYLTLRSTGLVRRHALDEVVADLAGLLAADGHYASDLALRFLGIECRGDRWPQLVASARLRIYLEEAELSQTATTALLRLVERAVRAIARGLEQAPWITQPEHRVALLLAALSLGLVGLGDPLLDRGETRLLASVEAATAQSGEAATVQSREA